MAVRDFTDAAGIAWRVWHTLPSTTSLLTAGYERGWLTFESADSLRRLTAVPPEWDELADEELEALCRTATPVPRRRQRPDRGSSSVPIGQ